MEIPKQKILANLIRPNMGRTSQATQIASTKIDHSPVDNWVFLGINNEIRIQKKASISTAPKKGLHQIPEVLDSDFVSFCINMNELGDWKIHRKIQ